MKSLSTKIIKILQNTPMLNRTPGSGLKSIGIWIYGMMNVKEEVQRV
ncbi:hypothetical protein J2S09_000733 [Bacillus fengqiuensis]|nr:hypothetical protein [Bacillus fengqiuensis]